MRRSLCALLPLLLVAACFNQTFAAEQTGFRWWPFGGDKSDAATTASESISAPSASAISLPAAAPSEASALGTTAPATTLDNTATATSLQLPVPPGPTAVTPDPSWTAESADSNIRWPKWEMPKVSLPKPRMPRVQFWPDEEQAEATRNAWAQASVEREQKKPMQSVRNGARRVGDGTRRAWHKTVDVLTPGTSDSAPDESRFASREVKPPFWRRMLGTDEPKPEGPRTITEWMAQERLDP